MTDRLDNWIDSWWSEPDRPETPRDGSVWTVFNPGPQDGAPGVMLALANAGEEVSVAVPLHFLAELRSPCQVRFENGELPFEGSAYAAPEMAIELRNAAFADARYHGELSSLGQERLRAALAEVRSIYESLEKLRSREKESGPEGLSDEEIAEAFEAGILRLAPPGATLAQRIDFKRRVSFNVMFHLERDIFQSTNGDLNRHLASQEKSKLVNPEDAESIYRSIEELLATLCPVPANERPEEKSAGTAIPDSLGRALAKAGESISEGDINLLRALISARLKNWNSARAFLEALLGSENSDLGLRGLVWINMNQPPADKKAAGELAALIAPNDPARSERLLKEAGSKEFHEFVRIEDLDREIMRVWDRAGIRRGKQ